MSRSRKLCIIFGIVFLLAGAFGILFSVFSNQKFKLDDDQFGSSEFVRISGEEYEKLKEEKKSFLVFVDQDGCITADGLEKISKETMDEKNLKVYEIMFADTRETSMFEKVKYYPSFVIIKNGEIVSWLKADADEDVERYKDKAELNLWLDKYIAW